MKVTFVHHSCFVIETESCYMVFDYFRGDKVNGYHFEGKLPKFDEEKEIYFFASHMHQDHWDVEILRMAERYPKVHYILSKDIRLGANYLKRNGIPNDIKNSITFVKPKEKYTLSDLKIHTLSSTDAGVAYLVKCDGLTLFHAGDLHDWRMEGAGDLVNGRMEKGFRSALRQIQEEHINLAFVVLDGRMGIHTNRGLDYFMQNINADYIFPMHMWQDYSLIGNYKKMCFNAKYTERIMDITHENQEFVF